MLIRLENIPVGTRPKHVWLQERERRYKRYPRFSVVGPALELTLGGSPPLESSPPTSSRETKHIHEPSKQPMLSEK